MNEPSAYSEALAFESAGDLPYDSKTESYVLPPDILEYYARIIAYKVAHNLRNGFTMDPDQDPLTYIDCGVDE
jgi:hypothetical protein